MSAQIRLIALPEPQTTEVSFRVAWAAAPAQRTDIWCAPALLDTDDGHVIDLGLLCAPTAVTWCTQRQVDLTTHRYDGPGPYTAQLRWGDAIASATIAPGRPELRAAADAQPTVALFLISQVAEQPMQRLVKLRVEGLTPGQLLRLDGGAGQVRWFADADSVGQEGIDAGAELGLEYAKPGPYVIMLDLLDADGFWLATLAQTPIKIAYPDETLAASTPAVSAAEPPAELPAAEALAEPQPWLPYRYIRPRYSVNTYASPGGGAVRRSVNPGIYLSVRAETTVGSQTWFKTAQGDWIAASAVTFMRPSELRGIELGEAPPPPPPPPSTDTRQGIVTATTLNVRARPGVAADNPPIGTLRSGAAVTIYAEQRVAGELWYRIGEGRWVHGGYVRINTAVPPPPLPTPPASDTRRGIVTATALNVRARPGAAANNPPVAVLRAGVAVTVYEARSIGGETWYRIGENRWVLGQWVRLLDASRSMAAAAVVPEMTLPTRLPAGWVVTSTLNVRARPGVTTDNPPVGQISHNQAVPILEERSVSGVRWFRIAEGQWVEGRNIGVARVKTRPTGIGAAERWVGVCLAEQTAVAYEGDRPVFAALIASGLPGTPTVQGIFRTWLRLDTGKMSGPGYYLEDVTWTCYFYSGYALHTAYWHDAFGKPRSHGCVNMSPHDAWWVYRWSAPGGKNSPMVYIYWA